MAHDILKLLHLLGVILLVGNVTVSSVWKLSADATRDPVVIAFAQRLVTRTDWFFTAWGIGLLIIGGYGAAWLSGMDALRDGWIIWSEALFALAGAIWLLALVPIQVRQARMARSFAPGRPIPPAYWRLCRWWIVLGVAATLPLLGALWVMLRRGW